MARLVVSGVKFAGHSKSEGTFWENRALKYPGSFREPISLRMISSSVA